MALDSATAIYVISCVRFRLVRLQAPLAFVHLQQGFVGHLISSAHAKAHETIQALPLSSQLYCMIACVGERRSHTGNAKLLSGITESCTVLALTG